MSVILFLIYLNHTLKFCPFCTRCTWQMSEPLTHPVRYKTGIPFWSPLSVTLKNFVWLLHHHLATGRRQVTKMKTVCFYTLFLMSWSWRHRGQQEACKPEQMCWLGNTARLLTWNSGESWLIVSVHFNFKEQRRWNLLQSDSSKSLSFLKQTKCIACIDVVICENCSG